MGTSPHGNRGERIWDPFVRLFHWSLAGSFAVAWIWRDDARTHETAGMAVLVLIIMRTAWGIAGPASARFETFVKGPVATVRYLVSIVRGNPEHHLGHNPAGAAMIGLLLVTLAVTTVSGILMSTVALWGNRPVQAVHGFAATAALWLVGGHLAGVLVASLQHREVLPVSMVTGRKKVPPGTPAFLGRARFTPVPVATALALVLVSGLVWYASAKVLNGSLWRMERILTKEANALGCPVESVEGPILAFYPALRAEYALRFNTSDPDYRAALPMAAVLQRANPDPVLAGRRTVCPAADAVSQKPAAMVLSKTVLASAGPLADFLPQAGKSVAGMMRHWLDTLAAWQPADPSGQPAPPPEIIATGAASSTTGAAAIAATGTAVAPSPAIAILPSRQQNATSGRAAAPKVRQPANAPLGGIADAARKAVKVPGRIVRQILDTDSGKRKRKRKGRRGS